jgi:hypothetical protein
MTYFSSNEVSDLGGNFDFSEVSAPTDAGNNEGIETCKMLVWNCNKVKNKYQSSNQNTSRRVTKHK